MRSWLHTYLSRAAHMPNEKLERLSTIFTGVLVVCALAVTGMVVRREFFPPARGAPPPVLPPLDVSARWPELTARGHLIGPEDAAIRIVEFSDFQCPFCASVQTTLRDVREKYPDKVAILYRHFPLSSIHPFARDAAVASACAGAQSRFEPYHDRLFSEQDSIGVKSWSSFAKDAGVPDLQAFELCLQRKEFESDVDADLRLAQRVGINGTPTFIVQGKMLREAPTLEAIERLINAAPIPVRLFAAPSSAARP